MSHATWSPNRTSQTWKNTIPTKWSGPHLNVFSALLKAGMRGISTEEQIECEPCDNPLCHHNYIADIIIQDSLIIEIHGPFKDEDYQAMRKHCLERAGYVVMIISTKAAMEIPGVITAKAQEILRLGSMEQELVKK